MNIGTITQLTNNPPRLEDLSAAFPCRAPSGCSPSPWRRMTPVEYARDYASFPPHRATVEMAVAGEPASAEVSVFIVSANAENQALTR